MTMYVQCKVCGAYLDSFDIKPHKCNPKETEVKPHKHAELIKAWADGATIEVWSPWGEEWRDATTPSWDGSNKYRIKPKSKPESKPKKVTLYIYNNIEEFKSWITHQPPDRVAQHDRYCQYMGSIEVTK